MVQQKSMGVSDTVSVVYKILYAHAHMYRENYNSIEMIGQKL